jgi:cytochrome c oxidase subunit II
VGVVACSEREPDRARVSKGPPTRAPAGLTQVEWGERLFWEHGCVGCHSIYGSPAVGSALDRRFFQPVALADGRTVAFDAAYVRESVRNPDAKRALGYRASMPRYGRAQLSDAQVDALVAYLRTLK